MAVPYAGPVPKEAVDYFERKSLRPAFDYRDVWLGEHATQFTVAKVTQADVLGTIHRSLTANLANGGTYEAWVAQLKPELEKAGWWGARKVVDPETGEEKTTDLSSPRRLKTIYETNMRAARATAQWQRIQRTKAALPYLIYELGPSAEHRPLHVAWSGTCLLADDPWFTTHYPQCGYGCKCHLRQVSKVQYDKLLNDGWQTPVVQNGRFVQVTSLKTGELLPTGRLKMERRPIQTVAPPVKLVPWKNKRTGMTEMVPDGIDPGFGFNPGAVARQAQAARIAIDKLPSLPAAIGSQLAEQLGPEIRPQMAIDAKAWASQVLQAGNAVGSGKIVGAMPPNVVKQLIARGAEPASAAIAINDATLLEMVNNADSQAVRSVHAAALGLVDGLANAAAILLDPATGRLVYVFNAADAGRFCISIDPSAVGTIETVNRITRGEVLSVLELERFELLSGSIPKDPS